MSWTPDLLADTSRPLHIRIRSSIRRAVQTGSLPPGTRLPPVRELAESYGVNRLTVLKAIDTLKRAGVVSTVQGKGVFVSESPGALLDGALAAPEGEPVFVAYAPGRLFFCEPKERPVCFRLNYASHAPERIDEGIRRLGRCLRACADSSREAP